MLDGLKINKGENTPTSTDSKESLPKNGIISQETQAKLQTIKNRPTKKGDQGIIYVGRLPSGFEESELKVFFEQFGKINRLRVSRSKKNGASRHYAFIEFAHRKVAEIAAETMNNYLISNRLLKCQFVPENKVHPGMVSKYKPPSISAVDKERAKLSLPKTAKQLKRINVRRVKSQDKLQAKLNALGIEYKFPEFSAVKSIPEAAKSLPKTKETKVEAESVSKATKPLPKSKKSKAAPETVKSLPKTKETKVEAESVSKATQPLPKSKKSKAAPEAVKSLPKAKKTKAESEPIPEAVKSLPKSKKGKAVPEVAKPLPKTKETKVEAEPISESTKLLPKNKKSKAIPELAKLSPKPKKSKAESNAGRAPEADEVLPKSKKAKVEAKAKHSNRSA
ncbi:hypothetical protein DSO57_1030783 [Entomophthora muscae]|uniref:Uncharacterized protein n=1 Tax=Entomophthora muscae TaxID=34485 RepID=A0ACC2RFG7_9FUNG|nr:hypothetical protein DSO57_1030783 [Entomophthora muscae]